MPSIQGIVNKHGRWIHLYVLKDENSKVDDEGNPQSKRDFFLVTFSVPQGQSRAFEAEADQIMQSFKRITAAEAKAVKPAVIRTRQVRSGETVASLAAKQPFGQYNELFFRTFNGLDGSAQPKVGSWVKWVE
jgi:predicted Zn-dependent protease